MLDKGKAASKVMRWNAGTDDSVVYKISPGICTIPANFTYTRPLRTFLSFGRFFDSSEITPSRTAITKLSFLHILYVGIQEKGLFTEMFIDYD